MTQHLPKFIAQGRSIRYECSCGERLDGGINHPVLDYFESTRAYRIHLADKIKAAQTAEKEVDPWQV